MNDVAAVLEAHLPQVRRLAGKAYRLMNGTVEMPLLVSVGLIGLWEASARHDRNAGSTLWDYARKRVWGAMLDEIRRLDRVTRHFRQRLKTEDAAGLGWVLIRPRNMEAAKNVPTDDNPEKTCHEKMRAQLVRSALERLKPSHQKVLKRLFYDDDRLNEVGRDWGFTESRVCQLKYAALGSLRSALADDGIVALADL